MDTKEIIEFIKTYNTYGIFAINIIILILMVILLIKQRRLNKKYKIFMTGSNAENLENVMLKRFEEIDGLNANVKDILANIENINENLILTYQKLGVVKYDAFREMGGKLSFILVLLDKRDNGFLLNSVHSSREGCYVYLKEIIKGESFLELSSEEKDALKQALNSNSYMG